MGLRELLYSLKIDLSGAAGPLDKLQKQVTNLQDDSAIELEVDTAGALGGLDELAKKQNVVVRSISDWEAELKRLKAERNKAEDTDSLSAYNDKIREAEKEVKKLKDLTGDIPVPDGNAFDGFVNGAKNAGDAVDDLASKTKGLESGGDSKGSFLNTFFSLDAVGKAGEFLDGFAEKGAETAQSMRSMAAATGLTGDALAQLEEAGTNAFQRGVGENVAEAMKAVTAAKQQLGDFLAPEQIEDFVVQASAIGKTFDKDVNEVIGGSRTLIKNFGVSGKEATDILAFGMQGAGSKMDDLLDTTDEYSQHAKAAGFSAQEFVGVLTTGIQAGARDTDKLADAIKETKIRLNAGDISSSLAGIATPITSTIQGIVAAGEAGKISVKEVMQQSAAEIERAFDAGQITDATRAKLQTAISGSPAEDIGAELYGKIFSAPIDVNQIQQKAQEVGKVVGEAAAPQGIFAELERSASAFTTKASAMFAPVISGAGGVLSSVGQIGPGIAVLQDKFDVFGKGASLVGKLKDGMGGAVGPLNIFTKGQAALNLVLNLNPAVKIAAIIGILAGALFLAYQKSETFRNAVDQLWAFIKAGGAFISDFVSNYVSSLIDAFEGVGDVVAGIVTLDFDRVKDGASKVGNAVKNAYVGSAQAGVKAFSSSLDESQKKLASNKTQGEQTGQKITGSFNDAKTSIDQTKASVGNLGDAFTAATSQAQAAANKFATEAAAINKQLRSGNISPEEKAALELKRKENREAAAQQAKELKDNNQLLDNELIRAGLKEGEKKDALAAAKAEADLAVRKLQQQIEAERFAKGESLTNADNLRLEEKRLEVLNKSLAAMKDPKARESLKLDITDVNNKILQLTATIKIDEEKAAEEIKKFRDGQLKVAFDKMAAEITVGIRPKEDSIDLIDQQIKKLESDSAAIRLKLTFDKDGNVTGVDTDAERAAVEQSNAIDAQLFALRRDRVTKTIELDQELRDARIKNIQDAEQKERAELAVTQAQELDYFTNRRATNIALTQRELDLEKEIKIKHQRELAELAKKYKVEEILSQKNLTKDFYDASLKLYQKFTDQRQAIQEVDAESAIADFDDRRTALERQLQLGEIDQKRYDLELRKIAKDRAEFEKGVESEKSGTIGVIVSNYLGEMGLKYADYFNNLFQQYLLDLVLFQQGEQDKTSATIEGATAREAATAGETGTAMKGASASILGAAAQQVAKVIAQVPFPLNIPAAIAASLAVTAILGKLKSAIGFETGGLGMVGEKGPEIIGPTRDFSHFATQLVTSTVQAVRSEMKGEAARSGGGIQKQVLSFQEARLSGDTIGLSVKAADVKGATELMLVP